MLGRGLNWLSSIGGSERSDIERSFDFVRWIERGAGFQFLVGLARLWAAPSQLSSSPSMVCIDHLLMGCLMSSMSIMVMRGKSGLTVKERSDNGGVSGDAVAILWSSVNSLSA